MTVQEAARAAVQHLKELFFDDVSDQPNGGDFRLEEVEYADDGSWELTISFLRRKPAGPSNPVRILGLDANREFKTVSLKPDGTVKSVRVRPIQVSR